MAQSNLPILSAEGGLSRYLQEIRKFPMLEPDEEFMLAKRYKEHEDPAAARSGGIGRCIAAIRPGACPLTERSGCPDIPHRSTA